MSEQDDIRATAVIPQQAGTPHITLFRGELQVYVTGVRGGVCLMISPADWRKLSAAVEAKIAEVEPVPVETGHDMGLTHAAEMFPQHQRAAKAEAAQSITAGMAASPVIANSPVLADYLACEGIEVGQ